MASAATGRVALLHIDADTFRSINTTLRSLVRLFRRDRYPDSHSQQLP